MLDVDVESSCEGGIVSIFISYAREDGLAVQDVRRDVERAGCDVWIDDVLSGGQSWWDVILHQIRGCELFVFALSPASIRSRGCQAELDYALAVKRPVLAVMVKPVSVQLAPQEIADSHIVDYTQRTPESAVALVTSVFGRVAAPPLPDPLPPDPATPMSYMNSYREQIDAAELSYQQQAQLMVALRDHLHDHDTRDVAIQLLTDLRARPDIVERVGRDIDEVLRSVDGSVARTDPIVPPTAEPETASAGWLPDPTKRFDYRFWDGTIWTDKVSSAGRQQTDPVIASRSPAAKLAAPTPAASASAAGEPTASAPARDESPARDASTTTAEPASTSPERGPLSGGIFALLLVASIFWGITGVIAGLVNMKHPARKRQARVLLWVGIAFVVINLLLWMFQSASAA
jgi:hypothetical protein